MIDDYLDYNFGLILKKLSAIENKLDGEAKIRMIIDITDNKVHKVMQVAAIIDTSEGKIIHVRTPNERETGWPKE